MIHPSVLIGGLTLLGAVSPLLTFARLFQMKEWRLDRLNEHLRREGWVRSLIGLLRGSVTLLYIAWTVVSLGSIMSTGGGGIAFVAMMTMMEILPWWLSIFALLFVVQFALGRQCMPVWTTKALLLVATSIACTILITITLINTLAALLFPLVIVLQPLVMIAAWTLWLPIDYVLKQRIMKQAAALRASWKNATVIGIAGSVGKTTTKELINHLLQDLHPITTPAHVNTEMGVAQWLLHTTYHIQHSRLFIVEMGAYRKGEIALLCRIAQPTIGVMTALGSDHLALFGSEEAIVEANGELLDALPSNGHAFLYGENDGCTQLAAKAHCPVTVTGKNDLVASNINNSPTGLTFSLLTSHFSLPLHGLHNVHNALLAIGVARHLGITDERIAELLRTFKGPAHTFSVREERGVLLLDDTYNISPLSIHAALDWAASQSARPRTLLTSGLQETGHDEKKFLLELGAKAKTCVERVVFTHPHGSDIFAEAFGKPVEILSSTTERVSPGSALLAVGRMPLATVEQLLTVS